MIDKQTVLQKESNKDISADNISYSPFFSNIGLVSGEDFCGIEKLCFHYNRATRDVFTPFLRLPDGMKKTECDLSGLVYSDEQRTAALSFFGTDSFLLECDAVESITLFGGISEECFSVWSEWDTEALFLRGYSRNPDGRDPDRYVPFLTVARVMNGKTDGGFPLTVTSDDQGLIRVAVCTELLELSEERLREKLSLAPKTRSEAAAMSEKHAEDCLPALHFTERSERENEMLIGALNGMLYNFASAPGSLSGFTAYYPNRGGYPCHFLWDTCFQNLALELISPDIAAESLLLIAHCQRGDGKYPQFMCSTWNRPLDTQPALVGWAAKRLYGILPDGEKKTDFARTMLASLEKNNRWWLSSRMTRFGLIYCDDGLETGQDNSPRFDGRILLALDMNSYLLSQLKATAFFARELSLPEKAEDWDREAAKLSENILRVLYDEKENIFFDALASNGEKVRIWSASCFLPLWAGVELKKEKAQAMIRDHLLDESRFYGRIPFPSIAYTEPVYESDGWWRGPTWPPIVWLMLETLKNHGFIKEYRQAAERFYGILLSDGEMHELFDSQTGKGLGNADQGWTQALFIKLFSVLNGFESLSIERMDESHISGVCEIEKKCFSSPWNENMLLPELENPDADFFVAIANGKPVGYAGMYRALDEGSMANIAVLPEYRRRGIAGRLLCTLEQTAKENGARFLTLEVRKSNHPAIALYRSHGFEPVGERKNYYTKPAENAVLMTLFFDKEGKEN